jgi:hypothetical protein
LLNLTTTGALVSTPVVLNCIVVAGIIELDETEVITRGVGPLPPPLTVLVLVPAFPPQPLRRRFRAVRKRTYAVV